MDVLPTNGRQRCKDRLGRMKERNGLWREGGGGGGAIEADERDRNNILVYFYIVSRSHRSLEKTSQIVNTQSQQYIYIYYIHICCI